MFIGFFVLLVTYYTCHVAESIQTREYNIGDDCPKSEEVNENRQINLNYDGQRVSSCSYMYFQGQGETLSDEYQVCVTPKWFRDYYCSVEIVFRSGYMGKKLKTFSCSSSYSSSKFCADTGKLLYIDFTQVYGKSTTGVSFRFLITGKKIDLSDIAWGVIGGVIGGILLVTLLTALFCWCVCKRKPTVGRVLTHTGQVTTSSVITQPTYPYPTSAAQPAGNITSYPAANYSTPYATDYGTQSSIQSSQTVEWQPPPKQASAPPPPSYDEIMN
ncbi:uncharacterized protein LOC134240672 [Saccostrea cucullata]|uniref:uncharacterized protein LOC134240672 n=1 Tax=Saccostrea cuccullata TaxID=36930 RepID=UPI002ED4BC51